MKTPTFCVVLFLIVALLLPACGGESSGAQPTQNSQAESQKYAGLKGNVTKGKDKYASVCLPCHGADGKGIPHLGKDLVSSNFSKGLSDAEFILLVVKGRPASDPLNTTKIDMPPRGGNPALTDQDIADIVAYVRTLQKQADLQLDTPYSGLSYVTVK
jgi:disulfide bond formation protein DsbB